MKKMMMSLFLVLAMALSVSAAYVAPTAEQLQQAANDPTTLASLRAGSTPKQGAVILRDVIVQVLALKLDPQTSQNRIAAIVKQGMKAFPGKAVALAKALGKAVAGSSVLGMNPALSDLIAGFIATEAGSSGAAAAHAFADRHSTSTGDSSINSSAPPVAPGYSGQNAPR